MAFIDDNQNKNLVPVSNHELARFERGAELPDIDLRAIFRALRRGLKTAVIIWVAIVIGSYFALIYMTEQYQADAKLLVKLGRENTEVPLAVDKGGIYATGVQKEEINSYINLLTSRNLIAETVSAVGVENFKFEAKEPETIVEGIKYYAKAFARNGKQLVRELAYFLDLKKELTDEEQALKLLQESLSVTRERDSNVISLVLTLPDGRLAQTTLNKLIDVYLRRHVDLRRDVDIARVFETQTNAYYQQLETLQAEMAKVRSDWNINSVSEQRTAMIGRLRDLKTASNDRARDINRLSSEESAILQQLVLMSDKVVNAEVYAVNPSILQIRERLVELEIQRVAVTNNYEEESEPVRRIDREIQELGALLTAQDAEFKDESTYGPNDRYEKLLSDLADLRIRKAGLAAAMERDTIFVAKLDADLAALSEGESILKMMELDWSVLQNKYLANASRREEASIKEAMNMSRIANIAILSPPVASSEPAGPSRLLLLLVSIVLGLFVALGIAFLREWSNDLVYEEGDVDGLDGLYPLGVVSVA